MKSERFSKLHIPKTIVVLGIAAAIVGVTSLLLAGLVATRSFTQSKESDSANQSPSTISLVGSDINAVAALGTIEPEGEVIRLSPTPFIEGAKVAQLLVDVGDWVKENQVLAILDSQDRLEAALEKAASQAKVAQARLEQVKAGAKAGEINAQQAKVDSLKAELKGQIAAQQAKIAQLESELQGERQAQEATIDRLEAELRNATTECNRYKRLLQDGAVTTSARDSNCLTQETAQKRHREAEVTLQKIVASREKQIQEAQVSLQRTIDTLQQQQNEAVATLERIAEVRSVDVAVAQAELEEAQAAVKQAKAELDTAYVRSPIAGQVLKINTRQGEIVQEKGILDLGQTQQMFVRAEVYETDIGRVRPGQKATITSSGFAGKLSGTVETIELQVNKKDVLGTDPVADVDARVVEVMIRLEPEDSQQVAGLTNLQVNTVIKTQPVGQSSNSLTQPEEPKKD